MANVERPLSPHIQVWRPTVTMVTSITHRITGGALGVGTLLLTWWLAAAAAGPEHYATAQAVLGSWFGRLVLFGFTWALFLHLCNGIRHLFWDMGYGYEIKTADRTAWIALAASLVLTILAFALAYFWY